MGEASIMLAGQVTDSPVALIIMAAVGLAIPALLIVSAWKVFTKAGQPGWASIVPVYNLVVLLQIAGKPAWWLVLLLITPASPIIWLMLMIDLANKFGKGIGFALGLIFLHPIFMAVLAFGGAEYGEAGVTRRAKVAKSGKRAKKGSSAEEELEKRISFIQEYIKLWRQFFESFAEGFEGRKIYKKDEEEFSRILNSLAHHHYRFTATIQPEMSGAGEIIKVLCEVISLSHLKGISEAQLSKIQIDWHTLFIQMNKGLGRWIARRPVTPEQQEQMAKRAGPPSQGPSAPRKQPGEPT